MSRDPVLRAWLWLIGFSLCSTALAIWHWPASLTPVAGTAILLLAWAKARMILRQYLGLAAAPFWLRGFSMSLGLFCLLLLGLYLIPVL